MFERLKIVEVRERRLARELIGMAVSLVAAMGLLFGMGAVTVRALRERLWRWTGRHPGWKPGNGGPGGWEAEVASVAHEPRPGGPLVLIDPLLVDEAQWRWLDGRELVILQGVSYHARSTPELVAKRGARLVAPGAAPPDGVAAFAVEGMDGDETAFWIPEHRALVLADAVIGAGDGKVRVAPQSWAKDPAYETRFRPSLRRLLDLPIELLLVSHGEPVLAGGRAALAEALEAPGWGVPA